MENGLGAVLLTRCVVVVQSKIVINLTNHKQFRVAGQLQNDRELCCHSRNQKSTTTTVAAVSYPIERESGKRYFKSTLRGIQRCHLVILYTNEYKL